MSSNAETNPFQGTWRLIETELWAQEDLDLVGPAQLTFEDDGLGEMHLIAINATLDYRLETRDGEPYIEFTWSGFDEGELRRLMDVLSSC